MLPTCIVEIVPNMSAGYGRSHSPRLPAGAAARPAENLRLDFARSPAGPG
jgi:hypothetical protein